jgi:hypothetical protein
MLPGRKQIAELTQVHELDHLRFAHDELRAPLDLLVVIRPAVTQGIARIIGPLDDFDQLPFDEVHEAHNDVLLRLRFQYESLAHV